MKPEVAELLQQMQGLLQRLGDALQVDAVSSTAAPKVPSQVPEGADPRLHDERALRIYHMPPATFRTKDGVTLAIDGQKPHWITINATGAMVLRACSGQQTLGDVAQALARRYGVAEDAALADTLAFLESLEAVDFVSQSPRLAPAYRGRASAIDLGRLADVYLFVTNDCNLRCTHCYVSSGEYVPPREMTTEEILGLVDQARDLGVSRFLVTGGEPFMVRDIWDIIRHITAESDLVLLTNGMFFSERNLARLKESIGRGRVSFQISLDGATAAMHDAIRGKGAFERTTAAIPRVITAGYEVAISTAVSLHTVEHMPEMTRLVGRLGARAHHILFMQEWGRAIDNKLALMIPPAQASRVLRDCVAVGEEIGVTIDNDASLRVRIRGKRGRKTDLCSCGWDTLAVFSDGQVYPCVWLAGAPGLECGSILERPLADIWRGSAVLEQVRNVSVQNKDVCSDCHLKFLCAGGSPCSSHFASLATTGKSDLQSAEPYCETFMDATHGMLWELGLSGVSATGGNDGYEAPRLFNAMDGAGAHCARPNTVACDRAFEVGSYHCVCVLESDVAEGAVVRPDLSESAHAADLHSPTASFHAIGHACVELLLPMAKMVRSLEPGQVLKVITDDIAAREDLGSWCRMTGNELVDRVKGEGCESYYIRRGRSI
jgi:radical SAM protein with 4Fe4S-binding SPASM domain